MKNAKTKKILAALVLALVVYAGFTLWNRQSVDSDINQAETISVNAEDLSAYIVSKQDLIRVTTPEIVDGSMTLLQTTQITGEARGPWFSEGSFPVEVVDMEGAMIAQGIAQANGEWMTESFVPFSVTLTLPANVVGQAGSLLLKKDNPSGEPQFDDLLEIPVIFK